MTIGLVTLIRLVVIAIGLAILVLAEGGLTSLVGLAVIAIGLWGSLMPNSLLTGYGPAEGQGAANAAPPTAPFRAEYFIEPEDDSAEEISVHRDSDGDLWIGQGDESIMFTPTEAAALRRVLRLLFDGPTQVWN